MTIVMPDHSDGLSAVNVLVEHLRAGFVSLFAAGTRPRGTYSAILEKPLVENPRMLSKWTVWEPEAFDGRNAEFVHTPGHDETGCFVTCWHHSGVIGCDWWLKFGFSKNMNPIESDVCFDPLKSLVATAE